MKKKYTKKHCFNLLKKVLIYTSNGVLMFITLIWLMTINGMLKGMIFIHITLIFVLTMILLGFIYYFIGGKE